MERVIKILAVSLLVALFASCEKKAVSDPANGGISLSCSQQKIDSYGGVFDVVINTNQNWTVETTQGWLYSDVTYGSGKSLIEITVEGNESPNADQGNVRIKTANGNIANITVNRDGTSSSAILYDICGNAYDVIKIDNRYWLAQNFRCDKYDTKSEGNGVAPYVNAGDKIKWDATSVSRGTELTSVQLANLGYLYTWDAAAGYNSIEVAQREAEEQRQGICPNGWRLPTQSDWDNLERFVANGGNKSKTGKYLRTQTGWFTGKQTASLVLSDFESNKFGFSALPAGYASLDKATNIGSRALFWTSTKSESSLAKYVTIYNTDSPLTKGLSRFNIGMSVRCVKK